MRQAAEAAVAADSCLEMPGAPHSRVRVHKPRPKTWPVLKAVPKSATSTTEPYLKFQLDVHADARNVFLTGYVLQHVEGGGSEDNPHNLFVWCDEEEEDKVRAGSGGSGRL